VEKDSKLFGRGSRDLGMFAQFSKKDHGPKYLRLRACP